MDAAPGIGQSSEVLSASISATDRLDRLTDLATPFAVRVVATLRIPDLIESGVCRLDALAKEADADADALGRLLRYLAHRDLFTEPAPDVFALTETGRLLCDRGPAGHRGWLDLTGLGMRMDLAYTGLLHSVRTGRECYSVVHGHDFWADLDADPQRQQYADGLMMSQNERTGPQVARLYDWGRVSQVIDVGGGSGALLATVLRAHPHLRGTLVDRPSPAQSTADRFAGSELADVAGRIEVVAGDFFGALPAGGDVYVVSRALTDWNDTDAAAILRRCRDACGVAGRVLIVEVLPTTPHVKHLAPFDLQMLAVVGGRERSTADFGTLAAQAGLAVSSIMHGSGGLVLIECANSIKSE